MTTNKAATFKKPVLPPTASDAVKDVLEKAKAWEGTINAWELLAESDALAQAESVDEAAESGRTLPLRGLVFGVKDVIDVAKLPTRAGSMSRADRGVEENDAALVGLLRNAGAVVLGKTRTTEYAFIDPTTTKNPHNVLFTPGGSSSGSGAVVGAGIVPMAIGTQTAGSLCRPAAYCGATSYKPTLGRLSTEGMVPLSQAFDTVGFISQSCALSVAIMRAVDPGFGTEFDAALKLGSGLNIGLFQSDLHRDAEEEQKQALADATDALRNLGARVSGFAEPVSAPEVIEWHRTVMLREALANHGAILDRNPDALKPKFRAALEQARSISDTALTEAEEGLSAATKVFWEAAEGFDLILSNPVPGPAPEGFSGTGNQAYLTPWTVYRGPLATIPWGLARNRMPLSVMLAARPGSDAQLLSAACELECDKPTLPIPRFT